MHPDNLQSLSRAKKEQQEEDNIMNEFKEKTKKVFSALVMMEKRWDNLDSHERATVEQVAQETGFDELGDFEEVVNKFKDFYQQMQRIEVIDGYQVYIDDNRKLNIISTNDEFKILYISDIMNLVKGNAQLGKDYIPKETMLKILDWYIEEV